MAKFKPINKNKAASGPPRPGAVPCAIVILGGILLFALLFYGALSSGTK